MLSGCTASWRAPVSQRGTEPTSKPLVTHSRTSQQRFGNWYVVQSGDTLYSIAWRSGKDFRQLASWNRIKEPYTIFAGQRLRLIPPPAAKPAPSPAKPASPVARKSTPRAPAVKTAKSPPKTQQKTVQNTGPLRWQWPVKGRVAQTFAKGDETRKGIKIAGRLGQPVLAAESGKVVYSGSGLIGYGRLIIIKHNKNYLSAYGHNRKILVKEGDQVTRGDRIAEMGRTGKGEPVLHFEIRRRGTPVNPLALLPKRR